jgi:hypothetical protein
MKSILIKERKMPRKNSPTKPVRSFRLSYECVRQLKDLAGTMGRMYREELRFGNLMIGEGGKPEDSYKTGIQKE